MHLQLQLQGGIDNGQTPVIPSASQEVFSSRQCRMHCCLFNARSVCNKLPELHHVLYSRSMDCVCVTESWLSEDIPVGFLDPECAYTTIRCDRSRNKGGGVCVFIRKSFSVLKYDLKQPPSVAEIVCFDVLNLSARYRIFAVYCPPSSCVRNINQPSKCMSELITCLEVNQDKHGINIIFGDFNCPDINWVSMTCSSDPCSNLLYDFVVCNGLTQCVSSPTRLSNILDLVIVNDPLVISSIEVNAPFSTSDHNIVDVDILYSAKSTALYDGLRKQYLWQSGDYVGLNEHLGSINWDNVLAYNLTVDNLWTAFTEILDHAIELFVPHKYVKMDQNRCSRSNNRKYPQHIREFVARKRCLWRHYKRDPTDDRRATLYKTVAKECRSAIHEFELSAEKKIIDAGNSGQFHNFINRKLGQTHKVGILKGMSGAVHTTDAEKADELNSYFSSINTVDNNVMPDFAVGRKDSNKLEDVHFTPNILVKVCKKIHTKLTTDPDGYPPILPY